MQKSIGMGDVTWAQTANDIADGGTFLESYLSVTLSFETWSWMMVM
jgi:hypothetical protein